MPLFAAMVLISSSMTINGEHSHRLVWHGVYRKKTFLMLVALTILKYEPIGDKLVTNLVQQLMLIYQQLI
ncbi:hypothetical protein ES705_45740 [subsurface metagenome]